MGVIRGGLMLSVKNGANDIDPKWINTAMEPEDLSCTEDEDRIFILDENGKSVEVEVADDAADD